MTKYGKICRFLSCPSRSKLHPGKKFSPFVKPWLDRERCLKWIKASGRDDLTAEEINKHYYVCEEHFLNNAPSVENPDPLPHNAMVSSNIPIQEDTSKNQGANDDKEEASVDDPPELLSNEIQGAPAPLTHDVQPAAGDASTYVKSPVYCLKSPARQAALALKKKAVFQREKPTYSFEMPVTPSSSRHQVINANEVTPSRRSHDAPAITENTGSSVPLEHDDLPSENVRNLQRRLFDEFGIDLSEGETDQDAGITPIASDTSHDVSMRSGEGSSSVEKNRSLLRPDWESNIEKDGKRSVSTQTLSQGYIRKLIAKGVLWTPATSIKKGQQGQKDSERSVPELRMSTANLGGEVTFMECEEEDPIERERGDDSDADGECIQPTREKTMPSGTGEESRASTASAGGGGGRWPSDSDCENEEGERRSTEKTSQHRKPFISYELVTVEADFKYFCGLDHRTFDILYRYPGGDEVCAHLKYESTSATPKKLRASRLSYRTPIVYDLMSLAKRIHRRVSGNFVWL